jgi:hypothetical protein
MPLINIEYDNEIVEKENMVFLSEAIRDIVSEVTDIEDVFVYGNSSEIKIRTAPIEIFIKMSDYKIKDSKKLTFEITKKLSEWKKENNFEYPINLTLIPMNWEVAINV